MLRLRNLFALAVVVAATVLVPAPHPLHARQQVEREVQVALDAGLGVVEIDARLRSELDLFSGFEGFVAVRLFRTAGGEHVLEIVFREGGAEARERRRLNDAQLAELRSTLQERLATAGRSRVLDREGRAGFVVGQTAVGLAYHGWVVPSVLDIDSGRGRVAAYLLTTGSSFLVPWIVSGRASMSVAQRDASFWGATRGIAYGHLAGVLVRPDPAERGFFDADERSRERTRLALGSAASVLGTLAGYHAARFSNEDPGTVALWSAAGDFGLAGAFATTYALGLFEGSRRCDGDLCYDDDFSWTRGGSALTMGLGLASLYGARAWGDRSSYTVGNARALRSFGLLGAHAVLPAAVELWEDEGRSGERFVVGSAALGSAAALYLGNRALSGASLSNGEGLLVLAGHVAGGLAALGITYLLDSAETGGAPLYLGTSAAGAALGSVLTFRAVR